MNAPEVPAERWLAMTRLDENRARIQLAKKAKVPVNAISNVAVWGNHSTTQYPDARNARIAGLPVYEVISDHGWLKGKFVETIQKRGAAVIEARGASSAASAANAVIDSVVSVRTPTPWGDWHSLAVISHGEYNVPEGLQFGCDPTDVDALCSDCRGRLRAAGVLPHHRRRMRVVELPINASEDRVVGTIDLEAALRTGTRRFEPGVLAEANRNILYVDEVNLLDDHLVDVLLDAAAMGVNVIEREGVSFSHPSRFILVGTMNPEEGELRPQLLDRFGLCVDVEGIRDPDERVLIAERDAAFKRGDHEFTNEFAAADSNLSRALAEAIGRVRDVRLTAGHARLISSICVEAEVLGHRADVVIDHAARALAAYRRHGSPSREDIYDAATLALAHRARQPLRRH